MSSCDVCVVIPYYRAKETIERAIESIYNQEELPKEVIIVNDNGNNLDDNLLEEIREKYNILNIVILKNEKNRGAAYSRNLGWEKATTKYIAFLDSDDAWEKEKLKIQFSLMELKSGVLSGHLLNISKENNNKTDYEEVNVKKLLIKNFLPTPTVMVKRDIKIRFDENKRYVDDHLLWLKICFEYKAGVFLINQKLAKVFKSMYGEGGLSSHLIRMEIGELDMYYKLYKEKYIGIIYLLLFINLSIIKFIKRIIVTLIKKMKT